MSSTRAALGKSDSEKPFPQSGSLCATAPASRRGRRFIIKRKLLFLYLSYFVLFGIIIQSAIEFWGSLELINVRVGG